MFRWLRRLLKDLWPKHSTTRASDILDRLGMVVPDPPKDIDYPETVGQWSVAFRFRIGKRLNSQETRLLFTLEGHPAHLKTFDGKPIRESAWLDLRVHGYPDKSSADSFLSKLRVIVQTAAVIRLTGIDPGNDNHLSGLGKTVREAIEARGATVLPDLHGGYTYQRSAFDVTHSMRGEADVLTSTDVFLAELERVARKPVTSNDKVLQSLDLISRSCVAEEPLSQAVLCIAAVEYLWSGTPWSAKQLELLDNLHQTAAASGLTESEKDEIDAAFKNIFKSVRQGLRRLIRDDLAMPIGDWKEFDSVYGLRSKIFHGTVVSRAEQNKLAQRAVVICRKVVLTAVQNL